MRRFTRLMFGWVFPIAAVLLWIVVLVTGGGFPLTAALLMGFASAYRLGESEGLEQRREQFEELRGRAAELERQARDFWRRVAR